MSDFRLSPGITPFLTDVWVVALPLALAVGYAWGDRRGLEIALGLVTFGLGTVKLVTDYSDLLDLPVALGGIAIGLAVIVVALDRPELRWMPGLLWRALGVLAIGVGLYKVLKDFYDPFDIELAALLAGLGVWFALARGRYARFESGGPVEPDPSGGGT